MCDVWYCLFGFYYYLDWLNYLLINNLYVTIANYFLTKDQLFLKIWYIFLNMGIEPRIKKSECDLFIYV